MPEASLQFCTHLWCLLQERGAYVAVQAWCGAVTADREVSSARGQECEAITVRPCEFNFFSVDGDAESGSASIKSTVIFGRNGDDNHDNDDRFRNTRPARTAGSGQRCREAGRVRGGERRPRQGQSQTARRSCDHDGRRDE